MPSPKSWTMTTRSWISWLRPARKLPTPRRPWKRVRPPRKRPRPAWKARRPTCRPSRPRWKLPSSRSPANPLRTTPRWQSWKTASPTWPTRSPRQRSSTRRRSPRRRPQKRPPDRKRQRKPQRRPQQKPLPRRDSRKRKPKDSSRTRTRITTVPVLLITALRAILPATTLRPAATAPPAEPPAPAATCGPCRGTRECPLPSATGTALTTVRSSTAAVTFPRPAVRPSGRPRAAWWSSLPMAPLTETTWSSRTAMGPVLCTPTSPSGLSLLARP